MTPRKAIFIVAGLLVVVFVTRGCAGVDLSREEALSIATAAFEAEDGYFEPEKTEARVLRQGIPTRAVWIVVFTVGRSRWVPHRFPPTRNGEDRRWYR